MIFLWNSEYRDNCPIWEDSQEIWVQALGGIWPSLSNTQTLAFNLAKTLNFMKFVEHTLTGFSVPFPRLYLPIHGPQWWFDHRGHTCENFSCSPCYCMASLLEQRQAYGPEITKGVGWQRSIQFKETWISLSDIKDRGIVPRFFFLIPESRWTVNRF